MQSKFLPRVFKTAWFQKAAKRAKISDSMLRFAILQVMQGQADDLGGGVFKKRLQNNMYRSLILAKGGHYWVYEYLFAKKDKENIEENELTKFRLLAKSYAGLSDKQIQQLIESGNFVEI